jgi:hypothetical protein
LNYGTKGKAKILKTGEQAFFGQELGIIFGECPWKALFPLPFFVKRQ